MTVYLMVLEPLEDRYTGQWYEWFPEVLNQEGVDVEVIEGEQTDHDLEGKYFLDPIGTNYYKSTQMASLLERIDKIDQNDTIFFFDLWYPGIEMLQYIRDMTDKDFSISGVLHAGTYDPADLTAQNGMQWWGEKLENSWFFAIDDICVATDFHKRMIIESREVLPDSIRVTGLPVDVQGLREEYKEEIESEDEDRIAFTGRLSEEKGIETVRSLQDVGHNIEATLDRDLSKNEYYEFLANSKAVIAPSQQETFGYGVIEGMALGCEPIVPDKLAFRDTVPKEYRYKNEVEMRKRCRAVEDARVRAEDNERPKPHELLDIVAPYQYENVIGEMIVEYER